jgi:hypothetical protein
VKPLMHQGCTTTVTTIWKRKKKDRKQRRGVPSLTTSMLIRRPPPLYPPCLPVFSGQPSPHFILPALFRMSSTFSQRKQRLGKLLFLVTFFSVFQRTTRVLYTRRLLVQRQWELQHPVAANISEKERGRALEVTCCLLVSSLLCSLCLILGFSTERENPIPAHFPI